MCVCMQIYVTQMSTGVILSLDSRDEFDQAHPTFLIKANAVPGHREPFGGGDGSVALVPALCA